MDGSYSAYIKSYQDFFSNILKLLKHLSKNDFEQVFRLLLELRKWADDDEMRELLSSFLLVTEFEETDLNGNDENGNDNDTENKKTTANGHNGKEATPEPVTHNGTSKNSGHSSLLNGSVTPKSRSQTVEKLSTSDNISKSAEHPCQPQEINKIGTMKSPSDKRMNNVKEEVLSNPSYSPSGVDNLISDFLKRSPKVNKKAKFKTESIESDSSQKQLLSTYYYDSLSSDELELVEGDQARQYENKSPKTSSKRTYPNKKQEAKRFKRSNFDDDKFNEQWSNETVTPGKIGFRRRQSIEKLRNNDKEIHSTNNQYSKKCLLCPFSGIRIVSHYVNQHPTYEVLISRPSSPMANLIKTGQMEKSTMLDGKIQGVCCFCELELVESKEQWIQHIIGHTGEFSYCCLACNGKFSDESMHPKCGGVQTKWIKLNALMMGNLALNSSGDIVGYMCSYCNYTQLKESNMRKHLTEQHNIIDNLNAHYEVVILLQNVKLNTYARKYRESQAQASPTRATVRDGGKVEKSSSSEIITGPKFVQNQKFKTSPISNPMNLISKREALERNEDLEKKTVDLDSI